MIEASNGMTIERSAISSYFSSLVNHFFKILPLREQEEETLKTYIESLQFELMGCKSAFPSVGDDASFITLISILQYLSDHQDCPVKAVRREVFRAISICNKLKNVYEECEVG